MASLNDPKFSNYLLDQRIDFLCRHKSMMLVGHTCITIMTVWFLSSRAAPMEIGIWLACMVSSTLFNNYCLVQRNPNSRGFAGDKWMHRATISSIFIGTTWGTVPLFFHVIDDLEFLVIVCCVYTGYVSAAIPSTFCHARLFCAFAGGITIPFWIMLFTNQGEAYEFIRIALILYIGILIYISLNLHQLFLRYVQISYEKLELIDDLETEREIGIKATLSKDQFFAAASHDLRQPLNAINLFIDALSYRLEKPDNKNIIDKIKRSLRNHNGMLHGVLDVSKLEANSVKYEPQNLHVNSLVDYLIDEHPNKPEGVEIVNAIDQKMHVYTDQTILRRIIGNVLDNAVKFTEQGKIVIKGKVDKGWAKISIIDTGIGIPANKMDLVFEDFQQLDNPERNRDKGLGLGLSIVKRLCSLAKIELELESQQNEGTKVHFLLATGKPPSHTNRVAPIG